MKKSIIAICGFVLFLAGCKEIGPPVNLTAGVVNTDTSYTVSPVPAADPHNVLFEVFTGQSCPNCPAAETTLGTFVPANRLNVMGLYVFGAGPQVEPPSGSAQDFQTQDATDISNDLYNNGAGNGLPCAGIDRAPVQFSPDWSQAFSQRLLIVDSLNDSVTSSFSVSDSIATITVWITYLQNVSTAQNLSIAIVEDSIVGFQEVPGKVDSSYVFNNVFRTMVTSEPYGDAILSTMAVKSAGLVNRRIYSYKIPSSVWNLAHCKVIAFVNNSNSVPTNDVFQSEQCSLMGQ